MTFKSITLKPIKSGSQRALAAYWVRLAAGRRFPAFTEFAVEPGMPDPKQLVVWNIEGCGRLLKFRALYQGEKIADVFNSTWAGKTMDEVVPMSLRRLSLDAAKECATSGCPIYTIISTIDSGLRKINCERLLLPFGRGESRVEQILGCLQLVSVSGTAVRLSNVLKDFEFQADLVFSGKIMPAAVETNATGRDVGRKSSKASSALTASAAGEAGEKRRAPRHSVVKAATIFFNKDRRTCTVRNISATGAFIESPDLATVPDAFTLVLEMETAPRHCSVAWRAKTRLGVRFT